METRFEMAGDLAVLTLARPERRNAYSEDMAEEIEAHLDALPATPARALLLRAEGQAFMAGGDIRHMASELEHGSTDYAVRRAHILRRGQEIIKRFKNLNLPSLAAVQGAAAGYGLGLALACDITVVAEEARLFPGHRGLGLAADGGLSWFLTRAVGAARARRFLMLDTCLTGLEAEALGLVSKAVPKESLEFQSFEIAKALAKGPRLALIEQRRLVDLAIDRSFDSALEEETAGFLDLAVRADHAAAVTAWVAGDEVTFND